MEQKEENGEGNVEAAATRMQADAAIGAGSEPRQASADMTGSGKPREEPLFKYWNCTLQFKYRFSLCSRS